MRPTQKLEQRPAQDQGEIRGFIDFGDGIFIRRSILDAHLG
jgi:hypothetical protein